MNTQTTAPMVTVTDFNPGQQVAVDGVTITD